MKFSEFLGGTYMLENGKPELLVPASSLEVLKVAVMYGADAVYIGGEMYGLRAKAKNFSMEDMAEGIRFAHEHGKRVFVTANILRITVIWKVCESISGSCIKSDRMR